MQGVYTEFTGSFSGGTLNSGRAMRKALAEGRVTPAMESDPYMLAPGTRGADLAYISTISRLNLAYISLHLAYVSLYRAYIAPGTRGADSAVGTADGMPAGFGWGLRRLQARAAG